MNNGKIKQLFHDPNEEFIAMLGQSYLTSILQGDLSKSVMILSSKRIYQKGKIFVQTPSGKFLSTKGSKVCAVKDITGTSYSENNAVPLLVMTIILIISAFIITGILSEHKFDGSALAIFGPFILFCALGYFFGRRRYFIVHYAGGAIATDARWYTLPELEAFQKAISIQKETLEQQLYK